ncbi:MAG: Hsp70 family protein, partial [Campylobacteraceae bacterium]|nr:Hsp70 family protein [Campylobacteraceae bacterium]
IHQTEKSLKDLGENISADDKANIEKALNELKETLKNENASKDEIDAKVKTLTEASHKLAEEIYKKEQGANSGAESKEGTAKKDDDVIDAEVE